MATLTGIVNYLDSALHSGIELAAAVVAVLRGDVLPLRAYGDRLAEIRRIYRSRVRAHYAEERRWSDSPFWHGRGG